MRVSIWWAVLALALLVVATGWGVGKSLDLQTAKQEAADAATQRAIWQSRFAEASSSVKVKTVHVTKWATRYDTLRALITDTVIAVPDSGTSVPTLGTLLEAADSTIVACRELVSSCEQFRITADSTIAATRREATAYKYLYNAVKDGPRLPRTIGLEYAPLTKDLRLYGTADLRLRRDLFLAGRLEMRSSADMARSEYGAWMGLKMNVP